MGGAAGRSPTRRSSASARWWRRAAAPIDDVRGSAAYRRHALGVLGRRTLAWAWEEQRMRLTLTVNGEPREADGVWEGESLLMALRDHLDLPGSKNACEQGECGSCSVYLDGELVCACLVLAGQAEGREVVTVEGLAAGEELHAVQQAFVETGAVQCGFCTPGLIVASHDLLSRNAYPTDPEIREALAGNLCRCTGYEKILDAVRLAGRAAYEDRHRGLRDRHGRRRRHRARDGHLVIEDDRIVAVGEGPAPRAGRDARRIDGRGCLATPGPRQLPPPPLPVGHPRPRPAGDAVRVARRALSGLGAHRRRGRVGGGARRPGRARALGLLDLDRPPLRLPGRRRRPARGRGRGGARARRALPPVPRLDGPRALRRRPAARRGGRGPRRDPRRQRGGDRPLPRPRARARWCASRSRRARRSR